MAKIIVLTGPESTGKSTLSKQLASYYKCKAYPEYARTYLNERGTTSYTYEDVEQIALGQLKQHQEASADKQHLYSFLDTWLIITKIWFQEVYHKEPEWLEIELEGKPVDLYLLCQPDLPWESDPLRENGGDRRMSLYAAYKDELDRRNCYYIEISGMGEQRLQNAIDALNECL
ncbi:MAG: AAA family ATPase [Mangrovibacterium sp.]